MKTPAEGPGSSYARAQVGPRFGILTFLSGPLDAIAAEWRRTEAIGFDNALVVDTLAKPRLVDWR